MGGLEAYHAAIDRVENSDEETIRHFGDYALPLVKRFMMMDEKEFQALEDSKGNAIYFPIMKKSISCVLRKACNSVNGCFTYLNSRNILLQL